MSGHEMKSTLTGVLLKRTWGERLADKGMLIAVGIIASVAIGCAFWAANRGIEFLGISPNTVTVLALLAMLIHSWMRIAQLEKMLEKRRSDAATSART